jgi:hypothetical protein
MKLYAVYIVDTVTKLATSAEYSGPDKAKFAQVFADCSAACLPGFQVMSFEEAV